MWPGSRKCERRGGTTAASGIWSSCRVPLDALDALSAATRFGGRARPDQSMRINNGRREFISNQGNQEGGGGVHGRGMDGSCFQLLSASSKDENRKPYTVSEFARREKRVPHACPEFPLGMQRQLTAGQLKRLEASRRPCQIYGLAWAGGGGHVTHGEAATGCFITTGDITAARCSPLAPPPPPLPPPSADNPRG